jgi:hypothetical protein
MDTRRSVRMWDRHEEIGEDVGWTQGDQGGCGMDRRRSGRMRHGHEEIREDVGWTQGDRGG